MEAKFMISEVFSTSWKYTKSQIWVLVGLLIGMFILSFTLGIFALPSSGSITGQIIVNFISIIISLIFSMGYIKNLFQTLDGIEPQFSAYGQQARKIFTYCTASIIVGIAVFIGCLVFLIPGIYLALRLQFFAAFIVEEDASFMDSIKRSWEITQGQVGQLFMLILAMLGIMIVGILLFGIGILFAMPLIYMMYCYTFRKLNTLTGTTTES
ncbi:glycerophosphoryl diester phosphodiesterase membrane domain-containing protein [Parabacteroides chinchillae]|uniref:Membrane domain of glycerophosphoryl diester phosphodiesterase n=1 Tax=Parabacteroides chinchillae TaxID=871327 RepID=A0A8G2BYF2_9BACT|nr:glycerophosphoryl diester phosphodiesterase membrane domain-containing protein [Parabacteroides chinchillae]SEG18849.1 Membrane domain of glycerophosphoryl diester phosphodiesterase [Parabacteroides chinchillae]